MGLFGGLFEKKCCDVCGEEIKLLGNRKLSDGNLCKNCAAKLSPWFSERKQSTVEEIREQLSYREENQANVEAFELTRTLGKGTKVLLDENNMKFMVTSASNYRTANPDVLDFSQVTGCNVDVNESKSEIRKKLPDGKYESYVPAQYDYSYDIYVTIYVNHPYFNEMRFRVNSNSINIKNPYVSENNNMSSQHPGMNQPGPGMNQAQARPGMNQARPGVNQARPGVNQARPGVNQARPGMNQARPGMNQARPGMNQARPGMNQARPGMNQARPGMNQGGPGMNQGGPGMGMQPRMQAFVPDPQNNMYYQEAQSVAEEIREVLTQVRETGREVYQSENAVKQPCQCPYCGALTTPDANGCCEYCGGSIETM